MDFESYKAERDRIDRAMRDASETIQKLREGKTGPMGLTPDHIKFSPEFKAARREYEVARTAMGELNRKHLKRFAKELTRERDERRIAVSIRA